MSQVTTNGGLFSWARCRLNSHRGIKLQNFEELHDGNILLHLWEISAPDITFGFVPGHSASSSDAASNISLLAEQLPSPLRLPPNSIGEGSCLRILEVISCWHISRAMGLPWDISERKPLATVIPRLSKAILEKVNQDLKGERIASLLALLEKDAKLFCAWLKVQCERVGEQFPAPSSLSGLQHCTRVAESKLSISVFEMPTKPTIIPIMLFISLFYEHDQFSSFESSNIGQIISENNKLFRDIESQKAQADGVSGLVLSSSQFSILSFGRDLCTKFSMNKNQTDSKGSAQPKQQQKQNPPQKNLEPPKKNPPPQSGQQNPPQKVESLQELSQRLGDDKMRYLAQIRDLMNMNQKKTQEIAKLKSQVKSGAPEAGTQRSRSPAPARPTADSKALEELQSKCDKLEKENQDLSEGIELLYESESRLMEKNRETQAELDMLSAMVEEIDISKSKGDDSDLVIKLTADNEALKETVARMNDELQKNQTYKEEITELNQMVQMLNNEMEALKTSEIKAQAKVQAHKSITPDEIWKQEMKKLQDEVNALHQREKIRARASTNLSKKDETLHLKLETLNTTVHDLSQELKDKNISHSRLANRNAELEKELREERNKLKQAQETCGNDTPFDTENPLPSLTAIADRLKHLDAKYSLHACSWKQMGLVLQAKMESDPAERNALFAKAQWH